VSGLLAFVKLRCFFLWHLNVYWFMTFAVCGLDTQEKRGGASSLFRWFWESLSSCQLVHGKLELFRLLYNIVHGFSSSLCELLLIFSLVRLCLQEKLLESCFDFFLIFFFSSPAISVLDSSLLINLLALTYIVRIKNKHSLSSFFPRVHTSRNFVVLRLVTNASVCSPEDMLYPRGNCKLYTPWLQRC